MTEQRDIVCVHSSDLHLSADGIIESESASSRLSSLERVFDAAISVGADVVLLAGDTFDHNRQPQEFIDRVTRTMKEYRKPIVILPGNHDPLTGDSVYRRAGLAADSNISVLGLTVGEAAVFPHLGLEVWGRAHMDYWDMSPLEKPRVRSTRWQLAAAHGHYVERIGEPGTLLGSWLIRDEDLAATGADYVALGHWNRAARVGGENIRAYYSGSPEYSGTVNVVRLRHDGSVEVSQSALRGPAAAP